MSAGGIPGLGWVAFVAATLVAGCATPPQTASEFQLAPSDAVQCLSTSTGRPERPAYPPGELKAGRGAEFRVVFTFDSASQPPQVDFPGPSAVLEFQDTVRQYGRLLRLPCMPAGAPPVTIAQTMTFLFDDDQVRVGEPQDAASAARAWMLNCIRHKSGERAPAYTQAALRSGLQGRVRSEMRFTDATSPPVGQATAPASLRPLRDAVTEWEQGLRMPCLTGPAINVSRTYVYRIEDTPRYGFQAMTLKTWVLNSRDIKAKGLQLDLNAMGCPFALQLTYLQPLKRHAVRQIGTPDARRAPFIDWLRDSQLDASQAQLDAAFGDTVRIDVPCLKIDIPPQEKS